MSLGDSPAVWAVVPAGGIGARMGSATPKQYLSLNGRPVIEHTLERLLGSPSVRRVVVAVATADGHWPRMALNAHPKVATVSGGRERCHSVLNALLGLAASGGSDDWVLVHDAVRPCLHPSDLQRLLTTLQEHPVGGLLGVPVRDTMKRADEQGTVRETVERAGLWHALTPQMFRLGVLSTALQGALARGELPTDESVAVERAGHAPRMVEGRADNIKITRHEDLALAAWLLQRQAQESALAAVG